MGSKIVNLEIFLIYFFLLIPWPHTHVFKRLCSIDNSRLVRKIVRSKWTPILDKYQVKLPLECPLHPFREIFAPRQDAKKRDRPTQWTCRLCGKSFYQEKYLDLHFETRHKTVINGAEDSVCLADYCDIMRCEVFQSEESSSLKFGDQNIVTDIEVWSDSLGQNSALAKANVAYLSLLPIRTSSTGASKVQTRQLCQDKIGQTKCQQTDSHQNSNENFYVYNGASGSNFPQAQSSDDSSTTSSATHIHHSSSSSSSSSSSTHSFSSSDTKSYTNKYSTSSETKTTTNQAQMHNQPTLSGEDSNKSFNNQASDKDDDDGNSKTNANASTDDSNKTSEAQMSNMQKIRANCKTEELSKLKAKCEYLIRSCIGGLILSMTDQQFKDMEEEMNKAVCWYLTCERYWEDGPLEPRAFPWGLIFILIFVLSIGICFCYYIIWILFDSEETTINATTNHHQLYIPNHQHYHPQHLQQQLQLQQQQQQQPIMHQEHYLFQDYPTTGIHHGMTNVEPQTNTSYYYQQQQVQAQHQQQQQQHLQQQQAELHHHQQAMQHDIYPEPVQYDYRHSPRRYIGDQRLPGTPTITMSGGGPIVGGQTPLRHPQTNLAYQQDTLDRRDYISRPVASGLNTHGPNSGSTGALSHHSAQMDCDNTLPATHLGSVGGVKHYNTIPRPLETRQRYVSGSQQSLRASSSSHEIIQNEVGHNEHYIYVTYPPDLKKRFFEKYE